MHNSNRSPRIIAAALGCAAFAIACVAGMAAHNPSNVVLSRALWALGICYVAGLALGAMGDIIIAQHIALYAKKNPVPEMKPLPAEPILVAELAEDQSGAHLASREAGVGPLSQSSQVSQIAQSAQPAATGRKAA